MGVGQRDFIAAVLVVNSEAGDVDPLARDGKFAADVDFGCVAEIGVGRAAVGVGDLGTGRLPAEARATAKARRRFVFMCVAPEFWMNGWKNSSVQANRPAQNASVLFEVLGLRGVRS